MEGRIKWLIDKVIIYIFIFWIIFRNQQIA